MFVNVTIYIILNSRGEVWTSSTWSRDHLKARFYRKLGDARAQVTHIVRDRDWETEVPEIVALHIGHAEVVRGERERVIAETEKLYAGQRDEILRRLGVR